ncbi:MAG: bifunctional oligoribonuclease/PAP phosphatase NrnA [Clostridia bacterium]|nr:bifunctional oligoribonuclease/PAP phosphatase NrnA [Clostridia bacterium]
MKQIIKQLKKSKRVAIIAHISPDPDCLSSMTALSCILKQFKKEVSMFVDTDSKRGIISFYNLPKGYDGDINPNDYDTIVTVDLPSVRQTGKHYAVISNFENVISIDHHASRDLPAKYAYVDANKSSCSEIIFDLAVAMRAKITPQIANYIFAGIIGDTNCFQNDNTNENTFRVAMECLKHGADKNNIVFIFQKHQTYEEIALRKYGYDNMKIKKQVAYVAFTKKIFEECGVDDSPTFVNEMLNTADNKIAFMVKQKDKNTYTVSLRSKEGYNVARVAEKFGGGGHKQASGFAFTGALIKNIDLIYKECLNEINQQDAN